MPEETLIKNMPFSQPVVMADLVDYAPGQVVSRTISQRPTVNTTLFAFDAGEAISTHSAPGDAIVYVLDGEATVTIDGEDFTVPAGEAIVMPANIPHGVRAEKRFKMFLLVVKP
jgi:quercetin dioxygenase-like cupin family protein